jgi:SAM-dependent methyltransferase
VSEGGLLSQSRLPRAWRAFQYLAGGTVAKRGLALELCAGRRRILEVGCSLGNIAQAFRGRGVEYTGIDVDPVAIAHARRHFAHVPGFRFVLGDLTAEPPELEGRRFDCVLLAGVLHHVDSATGARLLAAAAARLEPGGIVAVTDPLLPAPDDPWLVRRFIRVEQGSHVRTGEAHATLVAATPGLRLTRAEERLIPATPWGRPLVARFGVHALDAGAAPPPG